MCGGGFVRSTCGLAANLPYDPVSRPLLSFLDSADELNAPAPAELYAPVMPDPTLITLSQFPQDVASSILAYRGDPGTDGGARQAPCTPLNFKELYGAHTHRLRTLTDA